MTQNIELKDIAYELQKLYPSIRIPVPQYAEYYLRQLRKSSEYTGAGLQLTHTTQLLEAHGVEGKHGLDAGPYKQKLLQEFLAIMEARKEYLNSTSITEIARKNPLISKTVKYQDGRTYVSIDITSANYTIMRYYTGLKEADWPTWVAAHMPNMHPALVHSKSYRQNLFGNLAPKRIQALTCVLNAENVKLVEETGAFNIVGVSHDEIVVDVTDNTIQYSLLQALAWNPEVPVKLSMFTVSELLGEGKDAHVRLVREADKKADPMPSYYKQLKGVQGHRFFRLFKQYVLGEPLEDRDNIFMQDGHIALWQD